MPQFWSCNSREVVEGVAVVAVVTVVAVVLAERSLKQQAVSTVNIITIRSVMNC